jgi:hypothetical protein
MTNIDFVFKIYIFMRPKKINDFFYTLMCVQKRKFRILSFFYVSFFTAASEDQGKLYTIRCLERPLGIFMYGYFQVTWWHESETLSYFVQHSNITDPGGRGVWGVSQQRLAF